MEYKETLHRCEWHGCTKAGECRAPKSREIVQRFDSVDGNGMAMPQNSYFWFCTEHAREYNARWNYFSGMSREEIEQMQYDALLGHRPTWYRGIRANASTRAALNQENIEQALYEFLETGKQPRPRQNAAANVLKPKERKAMEALELSFPLTRSALKTRYKALVKQCHPDVNKGDKMMEERFRRVTEAYNILLKCEHIQ